MFQVVTKVLNFDFMGKGGGEEIIFKISFLTAKKYPGRSNKYLVIFDRRPAIGIFQEINII